MICEPKYRIEIHEREKLFYLKLNGNIPFEVLEDFIEKVGARNQIMLFDGGTFRILTKESSK